MEQRERPAPAWRWWVWLAFLAGWTVALLVPVPAGAGAVVGGDDVKFLLGKSLHVVVYAFLAALATWPPLHRRWRLLVPLGLAAHGAATEFVQNFVGRTGSVQDVLIDLAGIVLGLAVTWRRWR